MRCRVILLLLFCVPFLTVGCTRSPANVVRITSTSYNPNSQTIRVTTERVPENSTGENILNINDPEAVSHFASCAAPDAPAKQLLVLGLGNQETRSVEPTGNEEMASAGAIVFVRSSVPGVHIDPRIRPLARRNASARVKGDAVIREARKNLGTPYIWGHNEDRGQYGFDCSNYVAYVYHHALGYRISGASQYQYHHVGIRVARRYARVGDLIIFERGGHVGIYAGKNRVIQCGGGLGRVGYVSIGPRSYWGHHITEFKRMF